MTRDEKGYVQFACDWQRADPPAAPVVAELIRWRDRLHRLGLIGVYPDGIGFGNLSARTGDTFVISGTATGGLPALGPEHFTEVTGCDCQGNWLRCRGPVQASSESLSHAAVYAADPAVGAVIHVHHLGLWERLRDVTPTTDRSAEPGTPAMAAAIAGLFRRDHHVRPSGFFVMGGHREGLIGFGATVDEAGARVLAVFEQVHEV